MPSKTAKTTRGAKGNRAARRTTGAAASSRSKAPVAPRQPIGRPPTRDAARGEAYAAEEDPYEVRRRQNLAVADPDEDDEDEDEPEPGDENFSDYWASRAAHDHADEDEDDEDDDDDFGDPDPDPAEDTEDDDSDESDDDEDDELDEDEERDGETTAVGYLNGQIVQLPSGARVRLRPFSLITAVRRHMVPDSLLPAAQRLLFGEDKPQQPQARNRQEARRLGQRSAKAPQAQPSQRNQMRDTYKVMDWLVTQVVASFKVVRKSPENCAPDEVSIWDFSDADKIFIMQVSIQGQEDLASFRF